MRIAIVGSREYPRMDLVRARVTLLHRASPSAVIISGGAQGVDTVAAARARELGMRVEVILPDWGTHGRRAGILRNRQIVDRAGHVIAFTDGKSRETQSTMRWAERIGRPLEWYSASGWSSLWLKLDLESVAREERLERDTRAIGGAAR